MFLLDLLRRRNHDHKKDQVHYLTTLKGVVGMLRNPEGTESVFDIEDGLRDIRATEGVVTGAVAARIPKVAAADGGALPGRRRSTSTRSSGCPEGTLGHTFARHILDHGFDPDYYRKTRGRERPRLGDDAHAADARHLARDHRDRHRAAWVRLAVKAFELAQTWRPLAAVITSGGMLRYLFKRPRPARSR